MSSSLEAWEGGSGQLVLWEREAMRDSAFRKMEMSQVFQTTDVHQTNDASVALMRGKPSVLSSVVITSNARLPNFCFYTMLPRGRTLHLRPSATWIVEVHAQRGGKITSCNWIRTWFRSLTYWHQAGVKGSIEFIAVTRLMLRRPERLRGFRGRVFKGSGREGAVVCVKCVQFSVGIKVKFQADHPSPGFNQSRVHIFAINSFHLVGFCFL